MFITHANNICDYPESLTRTLYISEWSFHHHHATAALTEGHSPCDLTNLYSFHAYAPIVYTYMQTFSTLTANHRHDPQITPSAAKYQRAKFRIYTIIRTTEEKLHHTPGGIRGIMGRTSRRAVRFFDRRRVPLERRSMLPLVSKSPPR